MGGGSNLMEVDRKNLLRQTRDKWMASVEILSFPPPTNTRKNIESHPDIFQRHLVRDAITVGHVPVQDNHGGDVKRDR